MNFWDINFVIFYDTDLAKISGPYNIISNPMIQRNPIPCVCLSISISAILIAIPILVLKHKKKELIFS